MNKTDYIDENAGISRLRGNKAMYCKMLKMFLDSKSFDELEKSVTSGDIPAATDAAHAVKGIAGNLSLIKLFDDANTLMLALRNNLPYEDPLAAYRETLKVTIDYVKETIEQME